MGNATGTLKPKAWSVITYNAGLHDCDTREFVNSTKYAANLKAIFETLKPAASAVVFVTTTPYDNPISKDGKEALPAGIKMSCVVEYNEIARQVAQEVGGIVIDDLYGYVEDFCQFFPKDNASTGFAGNYTDCAIQTTGLHFFNNKPFPSGMQYTGISVAQAAIRLIPKEEINNSTDAATVAAAPETFDVKADPELGSCGNPPAALSKDMPNVLMIGDSISMPGSGYGPGVERIFMAPGVPFRNTSGAIASVQHSGGTGSNQAGPTPNGVACVKSWLGEEKWDVITINFGIHDCCPGGDGRKPGQDVPKDEYVKNLDIIYTAASAALAPSGKIVWVTTTPHSMYGTDCSITGAQFNTCISDYNAAALSLLSSKPDVVVSDLNAAVTAVCGKNYETCNLQRWHNVHFTSAGKQFCAVELAKTVAPLLAPRWLQLKP